MMLQEKEVTPESDDISTVSSRDNITVMTTRGRILGRSAALQRIGNQQDRWKRQVKIPLLLLGVFFNDFFRFKNKEGTFTTNIQCSTNVDSSKCSQFVILSWNKLCESFTFSLIHLLKYYLDDYEGRSNENKSMLLEARTDYSASPKTLLEIRNT